jgi:hypothetical protein
MEEENNKYIQDSYFEDLSYTKYKENDILNEENGRINFPYIKEDIKNLKSNFSSLKRNDIILLEKDFYACKTYEEKLEFWLKNELGLVNVNLSYKKKFENKKLLILLSIEPSNDTENNLYFEYLINWFNKFFTNSQLKYFTFETLKVNILNIGQLRKKIINIQLNSTKNRINDLISNEQFFTQKFVDEFRINRSYLLKDLYDGHITTDKIITIAYLISPILGYLEYEEFLNQKLASKDFISEIEKEKIELYSKGSPVLKGYTFNKGNFYTTEDINVIREKLIHEKIIKNISHDEFKNIFTEQPTSEIKNKIIWLLETNRSSNTFKRYDWQSLLSLINEISKPDFTNYKSEIKEIIKYSFEFPDDSLLTKIDDSFNDYIMVFEKNNRKSTEKIKKIFNFF